jgi:hypothetical protein
LNQLSSLFPGGGNISGYSSSLNQSSLAVAAIATFKCSAAIFKVSQQNLKQQF